MPHIHSFAPVSDADARVLILGSMPGNKSLEENRYYAHPQNAFWKIMGELVGASPDFPYEERLLLLKSSGIALWDVLAACERGKSSLDSDIRNESANDFESFFKGYPHITRVFLMAAKPGNASKNSCWGKKNKRCRRLGFIACPQPARPTPERAMLKKCGNGGQL